MRPKFGVEDQLKAYKDYKTHFARDMGFACLHYRLDSIITLWFCSTRLDQVLYRRTYAHFFPGEFQQLRDIHSKVRVPSSSNKKIINIGELCPTVDSPLERTSEGNPWVQRVDQVQNKTKNPFTYLMSTVASFKTPDDLLYCLFF